MAWSGQSWSDVPWSGSQLVKAAQVLTADSGAYTLTGQDATLRVSRVLTADSGSFVLTGEDASLLADRVLTALPGAFALAGQDAGLLATRVLASAAGVYLFTGQDATLTYTPVVPPDTGGEGFFRRIKRRIKRVFRPLQHYRLQADPGRFTLRGQDAALITSQPRHIALACEPCVLTLPSAAANLIVGRRIRGESGPFRLERGTARLAVSRLLAGGTGSHRLRGEAVLYVTPAPLELVWQPVDNEAWEMQRLASLLAVSDDEAAAIWFAAEVLEMWQ